MTVDSTIEEDAETKTIVDFYGADLHKKMEEVLGVMDVTLDGRFSSVRTMETNLGNDHKTVCAVVNCPSVIINGVYCMMKFYPIELSL